MIYGSGAVGGALAAGFLAQHAIEGMASASLERTRAVSKLMSLVNQNERAIGFTFEFAKEEAKALAIELGISIPEAALAMREAVTSAVSPLNSSAYVEMARMLSVIEGADLEKTVTALTAIKNAFGLTGDQMLSVPDVLFAGVDEGNLQLGKLSNQMGNAAAMAARAGMDIRELAAATSALTKAGMSSSTAFTSIRAFATLMQKPATARVQENRQLAMSAVPGLDFSPAGIQSEGFLEWLDKVNQAMDVTGLKLTDLIGGRERALRGVGLLLSTMNQSMKDIYAQQEANPGIGMQRGMEVMQDQMGKWERVKATFMAGWEDMGDFVMDIFSDMVGDGWEFEKTLLRIQKGFSFLIQSAGLLVMGFKKVGMYVNNIAAIVTLGKAGFHTNYDWEEADVMGVGKQRQKMDDLNRQIEAINKAQREGLDLTTHTYNPSSGAYEMTGPRAYGDVRDLGTSDEKRAEARAEVAFEGHIRRVKQLNDVLTDHQKHVTKVEQEKTRAIEQAIQRQRSLTLGFYKSLKQAVKEAADFQLSMQDRLRERRSEFAGTTKLQKFMSLQQQVADNRAKAATASKAGQFDQAKLYNKRAIDASDEMRNMDIKSLSETSYEDQQATVDQLVGATGKMSPLEIHRRNMAAQKRVDKTMKHLQDYTRNYETDPYLDPRNMSRHYSLSMMEQDIDTGSQIREVEQSSLAMQAEEANQVYTTLNERLKESRDIWAQITEDMKEVAKLFSDAQEANFQNDPAQVAHNLEARYRAIEANGIALGQIALPAGAGENDEVAKAKGDVYHQETIDIKIQVEGTGDPEAVAEAVAEKLRTGLDRKSISLTPTK